MGVDTSLAVTVGVLLLAGLGVNAVQAPAYAGGRFDSRFWQLPLDEKLDRVHAERRLWWWVSIWELVGLFLMTSGVVGLIGILGMHGWASVALGGYLAGMVSWSMGATLQGAAGSEAARQRAETGTTPAWVQMPWKAAWVCEFAWVVAANLAYLALGIAILGGDALPAWSGWTAIGLGALIPVVVGLWRELFPQLGTIVPFALGIAVLVSAS